MKKVEMQEIRNLKKLYRKGFEWLSVSGVPLTSEQYEYRQMRSYIRNLEQEFDVWFTDVSFADWKNTDDNYIHIYSRLCELENDEIKGV